MRSLLLFAFAFFPAVVLGQAPPATDLWLVPLPSDGQPIDPAAARNLTDREAYDNQPHFVADGSAVLYTSYRSDTEGLADDAGQTEVYRYDLASGEAVAVTDTPESEYSPTPLPGGGFSVIRVEVDGTQRLWRFGPDGEPTVVLADIAPVGYHAWADSVTLGLFVLGEPATLQQADVRTGRATVIARDIGRSLHRVPGTRSISFVHKEGANRWLIKTLDVDSGTVARVAATLPLREDYAWTPDGVLLMADGARLFRWSRSSPAWSQIADFSDRGIETITRLAVSPGGDRLVFVAN